MSVGPIPSSDTSDIYQHFNQPVTIGIISQSLTHLNFGSNSINQYLLDRSHHPWHTSRSLNRFNQSLGVGYIPPSVRDNNDIEIHICLNRFMYNQMIWMKHHRSECPESSLFTRLVNFIRLVTCAHRNAFEKKKIIMRYVTHSLAE